MQSKAYTIGAIGVKVVSSGTNIVPFPSSRIERLRLRLRLYAEHLGAHEIADEVEALGEIADPDEVAWLSTEIGRRLDAIYARQLMAEGRAPFCGEPMLTPPLMQKRAEDEKPASIFGHSFPSLEKAAQLLGGEASGGQISCPGPGHSASDRSLSVKPDKDAPEGFVVHSFSSDDPIACRDHVRQKLGLAAFEPKKNGGGKGGVNSGGGEPWRLLREHTYLDADNKPYLRTRKWKKPDGKEQWSQSHWDGKAWIKGKPKGEKIPYRLSELIAAPATTTIYFCEGEKDADALAKLGFVATTQSEGASAAWAPELTPYFKDRNVVILPDADAVGRKHGQKVAKAIDNVAASVKVVDLFPDRSDGSDVSDWLRNDSAGVKLLARIKEVPPWEPTADDELIAKLAALPRLQYAKQRKEAAKQVGITVGELDKAVAESDDDKDDKSAAAAVLKKQADFLIELAGAADLFHTPSGDAYVDVTVEDHRETYRVRSKSFRSWLAHRFYEERKGAPGSEAMQSALGVIEARALFEGPERAVHVRVAGHDGKLYLDLADQKWRAIEIDAAGWRVVPSPPVRFRRAPGMLALPEPARGGSINALRSLINVREGEAGDADFALTVAWLLAALRDVGPYPVLGLHGEHGTAKSTLTRLLRDLIDPNGAALRALPREDRDLFIAANNSHVLAFDNVTGLRSWISDTLCRLATGGGFSVRQLYTDDAEMLFDATRPAILNGIEDVATRPDLVDRSIVVTLEAIPEAERRPEKELWATFYKERPRILGALLDATAHGLKHLPDVRLERLPRMADLAIWIAACEPALWEPGTFATAYAANRQTAVSTAIEADLVASAVIKMTDADPSEWAGTASELLPILEVHVPEAQRRSKAWPTLPHHLTGRLRRTAPALRKMGITVGFERTGKKGTRAIHITKGQPAEKEGQRASAASAASATSNFNDLRPTLFDEPASAEASAESGDEMADAHADAHGQISVSRKPLKTQAADAADAADAHLRANSNGALPPSAEILGPASPGLRCELCGAGRHVYRLRRRPGAEPVDTHIACAARAWTAKPLVELPPDILDELRGDAGAREDIPDELEPPAPACAHCGQPLTGAEPETWINGESVRLHRDCQRPYLETSCDPAQHRDRDQGVRGGRIK